MALQDSQASRSIGRYRLLVSQHYQLLELPLGSRGSSVCLALLGIRSLVEGTPSLRKHMSNTDRLASSALSTLNGHDFKPSQVNINKEDVPFSWTFGAFEQELMMGALIFILQVSGDTWRAVTKKEIQGASARNDAPSWMRSPMWRFYEDNNEVLLNKMARKGFVMQSEEGVHVAAVAFQLLERHGWVKD